VEAYREHIAVSITPKPPLICFQRALSGPPTTHIFPAPPTSQGQLYPPQVILLPSLAHPSVHAHSQISEPALILVSPTGQVRFWPSIFLGLAGGDKFTAATLPFQPDENTSASARVGFNGAIIGSSRGRAFRISVTRKIDGEHTLTVSQLGAQQQSRGIFAYLTSFGGSPSSTGSGEPVAGVAIGAKAQDIWVLGTDKLALWRTPNAEGSETLIAEGEIVASLQEEILKLRYTRDSITEREWDRKALELEIEVHDIVLLSDYSSTETTTRPSVVTTRREGSTVIWEQGSALTGDGEDEEVKPVLLVSFWGREGDSDDWSGSRGVRRERLYATVGCRFEEDGCKCPLYSSHDCSSIISPVSSSPTPAPMLFQARHPSICGYESQHPSLLSCPQCITQCFFKGQHEKLRPPSDCSPVS